MKNINRVFLSLGTNVGDKEENLKQVIKELNSHDKIKISKYSGIYETSPVDYLEQDDFYNAVALIETELDEKELLKATKNIEKKMGRVKNIEKGPRIIDIDILYYEDERTNESEPTLPHKSMFERAFVLAPLIETLLEIYKPKRVKNIYNKDLIVCLSESLKTQKIKKTTTLYL